ncbi:MAG: PKD domain-containing protein [Bacteroidia bacterium]|nr:PKD domain-containing protein [Bacteroidia bacterium]
MRKNTTLLLFSIITFFSILLSNIESKACTECGITAIGTISGTSKICAKDTATYTYSGAKCLYSGCTLEYITYVYCGSTLIYQSSISTTPQIDIVLQNSGNYSVYGKVRAKGYSYWCKTNTICLTVNALPAAPTSSCTSITKCVNQSFTLSATPAYCTTIKWYKGDTYLGSGNSYTGSESTAGTYTYKAYSYNSSTGCTSATGLSFTVTITSGPTGLVINAPSTALVGESVSISGSANGSGNSFCWNFGSGATPATGTGAGPISVSYSTIGVKTITMTVKNGNCETQITKTITICPKAVITSPETSCTNTSMSFCASDMGANAVYNWNFGSGATPATATGKGPHSVSYSTTGAKTVSLKVTDNLLETCESVASKTIQINGVKDLVINAESSVLYGDTLVVSGSATGNNLTFTWNFGSNACPSTGTGPGPHKIVYTSVGSKTISMKVSNGSCSTTITKVITVCSGYKIEAPTSTCVNKKVNITATLKGSNSCSNTLSWNFGSGATPQTATGIGPHEVSYSTTGSKTITLNCGSCYSGNCTNTFTKQINVTEAECAEIKIPDFKIFMDTALTYTATIIPGATYSWSATGDAVINGSGDTVTILFPSAGTQTITLVTTLNGCSCTKTKAITVYEPVCNGVRFDYTTMPLNTNLKNYLYQDVSGNTVKLYKPSYESDLFHTGILFQRNGDTSITWKEKTSTTSTASIKFNRSANDLTFTIRDLDKPQSYNNEMIEIKAYFNGDLIPSSKIVADFNSNNISNISTSAYSVKFKGLVARGNTYSGNDLSLSFNSKVDSVFLTLSNTNGNNCGYKSDIGISRMCFCILEPLPVTWIKVKAVKEKSGNISINWATASEINNDYFTVEKSIDKINFEEIGKVAGSGNTSQITNYSFQDTKPNNSTTYYRVKQTDFDGKSAYSIIVAVKPENAIDNVKINPNPASSEVTLNWETGMRNDINIQVTNLVGTVLLSYNVPAELSSYILNLEAVQSGFYIVNIIHNNTKISKSKLVVKK